MKTLEQLTEAVGRGDREAVSSLIESAMMQEIGPKAILDALVAGMDDIGRRFKANEVFVPEVLIAARAMKTAMAKLEPILSEAGIRPAFTAVIGTVEGDLHDIGKNLVAMMWRGANFDVIDLGTNVSAQRFVVAAREHKASIIGLSALLTTTMPAMRQTVQTLREADLNGAKIVIGGAPITQSFADQIGADGFAPDAASAVDKVRQLVGAA
ncbi:MAG: corrinoid protein [Phycisphaeraceae bacterium]|nr:corrinoid protein [Phycisphaeraceae bacterium]